MAKFSPQSAERLAQAHPALQRVMNAAIVDFDFMVLCGHRGEADQNKAYEDGKSKAKWGQSPHNSEPSLAVDLAPYPIDWTNIAEFRRMASVIQGHAMRMGVPLSWGGNWRRLKDYPHFELANWRAMGDG
jgi:peptidoglycan L-alanyl-D-glutamate endopeptidase CwlK